MCSFSLDGKFLKEKNIYASKADGEGTIRSIRFTLLQIVCLNMAMGAQFQSLAIPPLLCLLYT